jgi:hypothetical protein
VTLWERGNSYLKRGFVADKLNKLESGLELPIGEGVWAVLRCVATKRENRPNAGLLETLDGVVS